MSDSYNLNGAESLAERVRAYWRVLGYAIETRLNPMRSPAKNAPVLFGLELVGFHNGLPPRSARIKP